MSELRDQLKEEFIDKEIRHIYCDAFLNSHIATQIKVLREQLGLTQKQLAKLANMKQSRVSVLEDVNYDSWTLSTLRRLAEVFDVALTVRFDSFGTKLDEIDQFSRQSLQVSPFKEDIAFNQNVYENIMPRNDSTIINIDHTANRFISKEHNLVPSGRIEVSTDPMTIIVVYTETQYELDDSVSVMPIQNIASN